MKVNLLAPFAKVLVKLKGHSAVDNLGHPGIGPCAINQKLLCVDAAQWLFENQLRQKRTQTDSGVERNASQQRGGARIDFGQN